MHCLVPPVAVRLVLAGAITIALAGSARCRAQGDGTVEWNRDIRPILAENCFSCHGPDQSQRKAKLRLDTKEGLFGTARHGTTVVPGNGEQSELVRRILARGTDDLMPPPEANKTLTAAQIELLQRWIAQGAPFEGHWAFQPIRSRLAVAPVDPTSVSAALDAWVTKGLAARGLALSSEADRATLLRRLSFDLIGLPPSEVEVAEFLADHDPDAYERTVDRLLASPHFGERMAVWWLDLVRYADTVGYHGDQPISVSPFRDHVIAAFNQNQPFDQFTIEQLAGDLLPSPTREQRIASGYNRLGMMSAEGGVQDKEYLAKYIAERVRNASGTWLGVTLGCAECHDHKFDPFTTRDFYRFEAFFADIQERGLYAGANDDGNWGPFVKVPTAAQAERSAELDRQIAATRQTLDTRTPALDAAQAGWEAAQVPWTWLTPVTMVSKNGAKLAVRADGAILASDGRPETDTYEFTFRELPAGVTALRLEVLPDDSLPAHGPGRAGNGNFVLTELVATVQNGTDAAQPVALQHPTASFEQADGASNPYGKWSIAAALDGDAKGASWGWAIMGNVGEAHTAIFETATNLTLPQGAVLAVRLEQNHGQGSHTIGCCRLAATTAPRPLLAAMALPASVAAVLAVPAGQRTAAQSGALAAHFRNIAPELQPVRERLAELEKQRKQLDAEIPSTPVTATVPPRPVRVLRRGNWMDDSGEIVLPAFPAVLAPKTPADRPLTRLDLAQWIVSDDNPLTARVVVNRLWKLCFGAGLSRRLDDLGTQGEWPSHPELLDDLAAAFRGRGWNVKYLLKSIVMSRTYRQSSHADAAARELDPYNRLLARQGRFRLDAEFVRDNALAVSGLLVPDVGGRSVFPYQPPGYWSYLNFPTREWRNGTGNDLYRRGLYTHWQRQYLHPSLLAFDAPTREECTAERPRSNTPLQSLVLLNDPSQVDAARAFAALVLQKGGATIRERLDFAFRRALSRPVADEEVAVLEPLLHAHAQQYAAEPGAVAELLRGGEKSSAPAASAVEWSAWTSVTRTILNLHESVTRN